jgi:peptidoglycan/LPS O-acetylase OafA/YrhL
LSSERAASPTGKGASSGGHILSLDSYRFLAASLIVVLHYDSDFTLGWSARLPTLRGLDLYVDFFFILSGFVIARTYAARVSSLPLYLTFLQKRFARIYPLHLLTLACVVAMVLLAKAVGAPINHPEAYDWNGLLPSILLVQAWGTLKSNVFNLPAWSISAEQFVYLLFPLFVLLGNRLPLAVNCLLVAGFVLAFQYSGLVPPGMRWNHVNADYGNLRAVPTFFVGVLMSQLLDRSRPRLILPWWVIHLIFVVCLVALLAGVPDEPILIGFAVILFCAANAELSGAPTILATPTFARLGDASFAIYLLHRVLNIPFVFLSRKLGLLDTTAAPFVALGTYVLCVALALLCYRYFESPARRYFGTLSFRRGARAQAASKS